jgi:hypothetical protein
MIPDLSEGENAQRFGFGNRMSAVVDIELLVDLVRVLGHRAWRDEQLGGDLLVGQALRQECQDF